MPACPFSWSVERRLVAGARRAGTSLERVDLADLALALPIDELVVCHGDACMPNTLITDDGSWSGHVDVGALGVADRWADLLEAYGIGPDAERTDYYRRLWDATS